MMMITQHSVMEENMSNLTCASGDQASVSSGGNHYFVQQPPKKKRNLPGNPDPDAEVISLSPKTLMATNRFVCEICKKGFQRDQNLQLHRRGHNLPWKLKQRNSKDVIRKKVYVCPEASCVHHDPSRALGDLTGIKKHFSRKHGEKKWKCEKCTKCYAVKSDWKAHCKICGTREYRCDCGTLFSRRDSFITHRGFCDALAEESAKSIATAHILNLQVQPHSFNTMKKEEEIFTTCPQAQTQLMNYHHHFNVDSNPNPSPGGPINMMSPTTGGGHMSATALLQKATQMGATMSSTSDSTGFGLHMSSRDQHHSFLSSSGNKAADDHQVVANSFLQDMMMMMMSQGSFVDDHHQTFDQDYGFDDHNIDDNHDQLVGISGNQDDGMTRDFLGLRPLSHAEILSIAAARNAPNGADDHQDHLN